MSVTLSHSSPSSICPAHPPKPSPKAKTWRPLNAHLIRVEKIHPFSAVPEALVLVFMILLTVAAFLCVDLAWEVPGTPFSSIWEAFLREVLSILTDIAIYVQEESDDKDALSVYDLDAVMRAINLLADDLEMVAVWRIHPAPVSTVAGS
ncbi:unnamed protein product [Durusdinium trenchii]|uniref:Uncharacterized protein n=1 Tax=Durusdinium trenchii TaxID=1381693 RepID=A0ABP0RB24_9DINO